jgi:hypothetical protein
MKVSLGNGFEDFDPDDPDIEFRKKRWDYWSILKKVRVEYLETIEQFDADDFGVYIEQNYGLKMHIVDGQITDKFDIVDEKLYTFFILKWM